MLNTIIDLSHHNTVTSFQEAKLNGIIGVIHKATQGRTIVDATYHARRARALANGLLWGAYHFGVKGNVADQVEHFLDTVNPTDTDFLVLDFEPNHESDTMTLTEAEEFVTLVSQKVGRFPGLYSEQSFLRQRLGNNTDTVLKNCFLWIARYSSELPIIPPAWETFTFWQYTDGNAGPQPHQVPGIGRCDRNKFNGSLEGLQNLWGIAGEMDFADAAEAEMTKPQCQIWIASEVKPRIRKAVEEWARTHVVSTDALGQLASWDKAAQISLISITNNQNPPVFSPDNCQMEPLDSLLSADTTVNEWEDIVWDNQNPETFCRNKYNL